MKQKLTVSQMITKLEAKFPGIRLKRGEEFADGHRDSVWSFTGDGGPNAYHFNYQVDSKKMPFGVSKEMVDFVGQWDAYWEWNDSETIFLWGVICDTPLEVEEEAAEPVKKVKPAGKEKIIIISLLQGEESSNEMVFRYNDYHMAMVRMHITAGWCGIPDDEQDVISDLGSSFENGDDAELSLIGSKGTASIKTLEIF